MRYSLAGKPPYKASLDEIRAFAMEMVTPGMGIEVHGDKKAIGRIGVLEENDEAKKDIEGAYGIYESYEKKTRDGNNVQQWLRKDGSVICDVIEVDPEEESAYMLKTGPSKLTGAPSREYTYRTLDRALIAGHEMIMGWPYKDEKSLLYMGVFSYPERLCTGYILRPEKSVTVYGEDMEWKVLRKNGTIGKKYTPNDPLIGPRGEDWDCIMDGTFNEKYVERVDRMKAGDDRRREIAETGKVMSKEEAEHTYSAQFIKRTDKKAVLRISRQASKSLMAKGYTKDEFTTAKSIISSFIARPTVFRDRYGLRTGERVVYDWEESFEDDLTTIIDFLRKNEIDTDASILDRKREEELTTYVEEAGIKPKGLRIEAIPDEELFPSQEEMKKASDKMMKRLHKKYTDAEIKTATAILVKRTHKNIDDLRAGIKVENIGDWTTVENDLVEIIEKMRKENLPPIEDISSHDIQVDIENLNREIDVGLMELEEKKAKMKELTDKALELEKTDGRAQLEEAVKDEMDEIKEMQSRRPVCWMRGQEMSDALYGLNNLAHVYFKAKELDDDVSDEFYLKDMHIPESEWKGLQEAMAKVTKVIGDAYDSYTTWLIDGSTGVKG